MAKGDFKKALEENSGDFEKSIAIIKESSLLPAVCGRVCPQEVQCQLNCTAGKALKSRDVKEELCDRCAGRYAAYCAGTYGGPLLDLLDWLVANFDEIFAMIEKIIALFS